MNFAKRKAQLKAELAQLDEEANLIRMFAQRIGEFYLAKNDGDYEKCADELALLHITDLAVTDDFVIITTGRPGLLIGNRGENISRLEACLEKQIKIVEDQWLLFDLMRPENPEQFWDYDDMYPEPNEEAKQAAKEFAEKYPPFRGVVDE